MLIEDSVEQSEYAGDCNSTITAILMKIYFIFFLKYEGDTE